MLARCRVFFAVLIVVLGTAGVNSVYAFGLGEITVNSALNEPLDASIELLQLDGMDESQILVALGSDADFERSNIQRLPFLLQVEFEIEILSEDTGILYLSTDSPVVEPYLDFLVNVRWPSGRLLREYTVLIDLPTFTDTPALPVQAAAVAVPEPEPEPEPEPGPGPVQQTAPQAVPAQAAVVPEPAAPVIEEPDSVEEIEIEAVTAVEESVPVIADVEEEIEEVAAVEEPAPIVVEEVAAVEEPAPVVVEEVAAVEEPAPVVEEGQTIVTQTNDTLWQIALDSRPDNSISVQQMMLSIQRTNEDAFVDNNINRLRTGQILRIPTIDEILLLNRQQAVEQVALQNLLAGNIVDAEPLAANTNPNAALAVNDSGDELTVLTEGSGEIGVEAAGGENLDAIIGALENDLMLSEENLDRARVENEEIVSRLADIETEIEILQNIIAIEDQRIAQLQAELAAQAEAVILAEPIPIVAQPEDDGIMGWLDNLLQNTAAMFASLVILVSLALGFLVWRRMKAEDQDYDDFHPDDEKLESEFENESVELVEDKSSEAVDDFVEAKTSDAATPEEDSALESDVSEDEEASAEGEDITEESDVSEEEDFTDEDDRGDIAIDDGAMQPTQEQASDEDREDVDTERESDEQSDQETEDNEAKDDAEEPGEDGETIELDSDDSSQESIKEQPSEEVSIEEDPETLDGSHIENDTVSETDGDEADDSQDDKLSDFEIDNESSAEAGATETTVDSEAKEAEEDSEIEFELDESALSQDASEGGIDFELADDESDEEASPAKETRDEETLGVFDIEFEDSEAEDVEKASPAKETRDEETSGVFDIEFEDSEAEDVEDDGAIEIEPLTDKDEVATKLDLAVAYQAMDDLDGAREILNEVIDKGNKSQIAEAIKLLKEWKDSDSSD